MNFKQTTTCSLLMYDLLEEVKVEDHHHSSMELEMEIEMNNSCLFLKLLPVEIVADILSRLPTESVLQCKLVCKTWRDLIADHHHHVEKAAGGFLLRIPHGHGGSKPGFYYGEYCHDDKVPCFNLTRKTIIHYEYPFEKSRNWYIVGSCNGLICFCHNLHGHCSSFSCEPGTHHHYDDMYVCNPYTGEYAKLPNPSYPRLLDHPHSIDKTDGFGYHPITKEYKVINIYYISNSRYEPSNSVYVEVYTLGSDTCAWRNITATAWGSIVKHKLDRSTCRWGIESDNNSRGILLNGVLYWLTQTRKLIISFDMADEEFRDISTTPPEFHGLGVLGGLNGCLCCSMGIYDNTRIWVMNNNDYSWSQKFSISWESPSGCFDYCHPLAGLESGKILLCCNFDILVSYDTETKHIVKVKKMNSSFDIIPYMKKSSVSLKALGEKEAIQARALDEN